VSVLWISFSLTPNRFILRFPYNYSIDNSSWFFLSIRRIVSFPINFLSFSTAINRIIALRNVYLFGLIDILIQNFSHAWNWARKCCFILFNFVRASLCFIEKENVRLLIKLLSLFIIWTVIILHKTFIFLERCEHLRCRWVRSANLTRYLLIIVFSICRNASVFYKLRSKFWYWCLVHLQNLFFFFVVVVVVVVPETHTCASYYLLESLWF